MKPPKNFYSNLDRRKQGLPEVPEASASDAGKIIKVGEDGSYELGEDENTIPEPTAADAGKVLSVDNNGAWKLDNISSGGNEEIFLLETSVDSCELRNGKTVGDIVSAIKNGKNVILYASQTDTLSDGRLMGEYYVANIGYTSGTMLIFSVNTSNASLNIYKSANRTTGNKFNKVTT